MADAATQAQTANKKAKKPKLPAVQRIYPSKDEIDKGQAEAKKVGYRPRRVRKFELSDGNGHKHFVLAGSPKDAFGRAGQHKLLGWTATELDAPTAEVAPTADAVLSAMSMLSDSDREKIRAALAAKKPR